ncbi:PaaI family thioesterase [Cupriavidus sp. 30B13]|uniref:PaaI family thioesterase n=1 Tax=Cupriavidus sp. 30B13 TaxID=3384241 RepID=UPI003B90776E
MSVDPTRVPAAAIPPGYVAIPTEPFMEAVGPVYRRINAAGYWDIGCRAMPHHGNRFGRMHGGMLATLADYVIGFNLLADADPRLQLATVSLNLDFQAGAGIGEWIEATVCIDKPAGRLRFASCMLRGEGGRLLLRGSGVFSAVIAGQSCA